MAADLDSKLEKLVNGQVTYKSANLGLNLLISRLQQKYAKNQKPEELHNCMQEMKAFFEKYNSIMTKDIEALKML